MSDAGGAAKSQPILNQQQGMRLGNIWESAETLSDQSPWTYAPPGVNSYIAGRDPAYSSAISRLEQRGADGSPITGSAQGLVNSTLQGDYLNSNPYLDETYSRGAAGMSREYLRTVLPAIEGRFARAGQADSPQYTSALSDSRRALAEGLGGMANDMYGGNYQAERDRQQQALGMAPGVAGMDVADIELQRTAGAEREAFAQRQLDEVRAKHEYGQAEPWERLGRYSAMLGQPAWGTSTTAGRAPTMATISSMITGILNPASSMMGGAMGK